MKSVKRLLTLFVVMAALLLTPVLQSDAAGQNPGRVKKLTGKTASETTAKLTWSRVSKANGYYVYRLNETTGTSKRIAVTSKTSYTVKSMNPYQQYSFQVYAYRKVKGKTYTSLVGSPVKRIKTSVYTPAAPSNLKLSSRGDCTAKLEWSKAKNATGYYLYQKDSTGKEKKIATLKGTSYTVKKMKDGEKYRYRVQAYRTVKGHTKVGKFSKTLSVTGKAYSEAGKAVHGRYFNATVRSNTTATRVDNNKSIKISKGTKLTATTRSSNTLTAIMKNGTKIRIKGSKLRYNSLKTTTKEYSRNAKEAFVNDRGYSSNTRYLIWISQYTLNVNIFRGKQGNWKLVRSMPCIIGKDGKTPMGTFKLCRRTTAYGGPCVYFTWNNIKMWGNSFHRRVDGRTRGAYSSGCIRLSDSDLNYLVRNCAMGTTVVSY